MKYRMVSVRLDAVDALTGLTVDAGRFERDALGCFEPGAWQKVGTAPVTLSAAHVKDIHSIIHTLRRYVPYLRDAVVKEAG